ncbi:MAG: hypothetical protein MUO92_02215, partial [Dehalococcoidales bacterium]|nr:hypothetical protein [Dehalococcoidales bacterium]
MPRLLPVTIASIISLILISAMVSCAPTGTTTNVSSGDIDAFHSSLENSDFTLKLAPFVHVDLIKLYEAGKLANAAGNNASAPYRGVFGAVPDNVEIKDVNQLSNAQEMVDNWLYNIPGLIQGWQLNPDEAVVLVTKTPPECAYFSYCGFIFYKYYEKDQQRKWVWTSYNDPLNNLTIKTSGTPNGAKGNPFNQDTIIKLNLSWTKYFPACSS